MEYQRRVCILIATHKKYRMPKEQIYLPLHVGAEGKLDKNGNNLDLGYQKDNVGENISEKNSSFCELTGLYWAWKNISSEYIGLVHYRRYFARKRIKKDPFENILNSEEIIELLNTYRIIVPRKRKYYIESLYSHYAHTHYAEHLDKTREIIEQFYPQYIQTFDMVLKRRWGYMFNMMIMEKNLINQYCEWLFDILFKLEKAVSHQNLSQYQNRLYGRVSEIIFNVWLQYYLDNEKISKSEIIELPYIYTESINKKKKVISFLQAKFKNQKYERSF